jgi:hypothetical protein
MTTCFGTKPARHGSVGNSGFARRSVTDDRESLASDCFGAATESRGETGMASGFAQIARATAARLVASSATYVLVIERLLRGIDNSRLRLIFGVPIP